MGTRNLLAENPRKKCRNYAFWKRIASQSADWLAMTGFFDSLNMPPAYFLNVSTLSVNASRCHLSQRERQGQAAPQPFNVPAAYIVRTGTQGQIFHTSYR